MALIFPGGLNDSKTARFYKTEPQVLPVWLLPPDDALGDTIVSRRRYLDANFTILAENTVT